MQLWRMPLWAVPDMTLVMNSHPEGLRLGPQVATVEY
jgi:hypothetical protein